jgi:23S rRNA (adenine2030-N6)-methyltransferase
MLSYQHAFHAGNAADLHKHLALVLLLEHLRRKPKPFCYIDCHAGRGFYDLNSEAARMTGEADQGIRRLDATSASPPAAIERYLGIVRALNPDGPLRRYPGSPGLAAALMRDCDRGMLLELHPQEVAALRSAAGSDRRIAIHARNCYEGLPALLPPAIRRGLVLIDPSYEVKSEYDAAATLLLAACVRWPKGIFVLWYPLLAARRHERLLRSLQARAPAGTLVSEFRYAPAAAGLRGSGLVIVNPPWKLDIQIGSAMDYVRTAIGSAGDHSLHALHAKRR